MRSIRKAMVVYRRYFAGQKGGVKLNALSIANLLIASLSPYVFGRVLDAVTLGEKQQLVIMLMVYLLVNIIVHATSFAQSFFTSWIQQQRTNSLKNKFMAIILELPWHAKQKYLDADIINRIESDCNMVASYSIGVISSVLSIISNSIFSLIFLVTLSITSSIISCSLIPVVFLINYFFRKSMRKVELESKLVKDKTTNFLIDTISNHLHIKNFGIASLFIESYRSILNENRDVSLKETNLHLSNDFIKNCISFIFNVIMLYDFSRQILLGLLTIGNLVSFNSYLNRLYGAVSQLSSLSMSQVSVDLCINRLDELEQSLKDCKTHGRNTQLSSGINSVLLNDLSFEYDSNRVILNHVSVSWTRPGLYIIVGSNGCGKTTLFRLLRGLLTCSNNTIYYNNIDIHDLDESTLKSEVYLCTKDVYLLQGSIFQNIDIMGTASNQEEIKKACKAVGLHNDIMILNQKYDTILGFDGVSFSNGQKQKLNIARALIAKHSFYMFDEPTSDLDTLSESKVMTALRGLAENAIVLCISHRESSIDRNNLYASLNDGKIAVYSSHKFTSDEALVL
jgi:ABC-type bacteriocin/lantibiotic exporter with double-glycine peptidase domain